MNNYLVETRKHTDTYVVDVENADYTFTSGSWRSDMPMIGFPNTFDRNTLEMPNNSACF